MGKMISVIVPTHNRLELLQKKLQALKAQGSGFEVVVVCNPDDESLNFLQMFQPNYPLKVVQIAETLAGPKRNRGAAQAKGEYLLFSDDDVVPKEGWLEAFEQAFARRPTVYLGAFDFVEGKPWKPSYRLGKLTFNNLNGVALGIPRAWFEQVGGFADWMKTYGGEDLELGYRLVRAGYSLEYLEAAKALHLGSTPALDLRRARLAGAQAARIVRHHKDARLALELGVHPLVLALKMALIPSLKMLPGVQLDGDLAYSWGAWETRYED